MKSKSPFASVVVIEGSSGSGKTALLQSLAARYGCEVIEVGVLVRVLAWWIATKRSSIPDAVAAMARFYEEGALGWDEVGEVGLAAIDVRVSGHRLRVESLGPRVGRDIAAISTNETGMQWIHALVRNHVRGRSAAISGRDVAAHTVPEARLVIRLAADSGVRRRRKLAQLLAAGLPPGWSDDDALLPPPLSQAVHIDTTRLGPETVLERASTLIESRVGWVAMGRSSELRFPARTKD